MIERKRIVALLPVRGGSKRLPRKNTLVIYQNKSLLEYAVDKLMRSKYVDEIIISTEDEQIMGKAFALKKVGSRPHVTIVQRSPEAATDHAIIMDVVKDTYDYLKMYDYVLVHQVDLPLTRWQDFDMAIEKFHASAETADILLSAGSDGHQNGAIRIFKREVMKRGALENIITTYRLLSPQIDVHTEGDLFQARVEVDRLERKDTVR